MHSTNYLWLRIETNLDGKLERQAEEFAYALLIDENEAHSEGITDVNSLATYFKVPSHIIQTRLEQVGPTQ